MGYRLSLCQKQGIPQNLPLTNDDSSMFNWRLKNKIKFGVMFGKMNKQCNKKDVV